MFNNLRGMLWLMCSVSLCLGAVVFTLGGIRQQDAALKNLAVHIQGQKRGVSSLNEGLLTGTAVHNRSTTIRLQAGTNSGSKNDYYKSGPQSNVLSSGE